MDLRLCPRFLLAGAIAGLLALHAAHGLEHASDWPNFQESGEAPVPSDLLTSRSTSFGSMADSFTVSPDISRVTAM